MKTNDEPPVFSGLCEGGFDLFAGTIFCLKHAAGPNCVMHTSPDPFVQQGRKSLVSVTGHVKKGLEDLESHGLAI